MLLLTEKIMRVYFGFYQDLSGCYMILLNCIPALTLTRKIILLQYLNDGGVKMKSSKDNVLI